MLPLPTSFLSSNATSFANSTDQNFITFEEQKGRSEEIAPRIIYSTARTMAITPDLVPQTYDFNVTWSFPVHPGYLYFVRLHFCDFLSDPGELYFDVYIGDKLATKDLHPQDETDGKLSSAFYMDYAASPTGPGFINISIGRASKHMQPSSINAILNGLEIMKVNNSGSSLDGGSLSTSVDGGKKKMTIGHVLVLIAAIVGALVIAAGLGACLFFLCSSRRNRRPKTSPSPSSSKQKESAASWSPFRANRATPFTSIEGTTTPGASPIPNMGSLHIPLAEIKLATNGFDESFLIGNGGFGKVYRGVLTDGRKVAVKRATPGSRQGFPEFQTEIVVLSNIRHRHLVSLIGFCGEQSEMILVYEYMERGPLKNYLYGDGGGEDLPCLSWKQRLEICIVAARGIHYLHTGYSYNIIHRDVKSSNILLADDFSAKVADFGLSRLGPSFGETHVSTAVKGTFGYLDPEYFKMQKLTDKSDVYSFGVLLFEVLCARPAIDQTVGREQSNLAEWALYCHNKGVLEKIVDARIAGTINGNSLRMLGKTVARCLAEYGVDRPTMGDVLWNLEYALQLQQTEVRREPHEDSVKVEVGIEVAAVKRAPPPGVVAGGGEGGNSEMSTRNVFSQLITDEGR